MRTLSCPICRKPVAEDGVEMPFCSARCRLLDLGNWASGKYVISSPVTDTDEDDVGRPDETDED